MAYDGLTHDPLRDQVRTTRALRYSVWDGVFHAIMLGVGESYLGAFAVELGHRDTALAVLMTVPLLIGALSQLLSAPLCRALGSRKQLVVLGAAVQAVSHVGFILIAHFGITNFWTLLAVQSLFYVSGTLIAPAWGAWMANLTQGLDRERYFAVRSSAVQGGLLLSYAAGGLLLQRATHTGARHALPMFVLLHAAALLTRCVSAWALSKQDDSAQKLPPERTLTLFRRALRTSDWKTSTYLWTLMLGAYVSVPFYTPYMLTELRFDYLAFACMTATPILTKAVSYPLFCPLARRFGMRQLMLASGLGVAGVALSWASFRSFTPLLLAQGLSGVAWGALEFTSFQLLLVSAKDDCRAEFLSVANTVGGVVQLGGALIGGFALRAAHLPYQSIFLLSGVLRLAPILFALPMLLRFRKPPSASDSAPPQPHGAYDGLVRTA